MSNVFANANTIEVANTAPTKKNVTNAKTPVICTGPATDKEGHSGYTILENNNSSFYEKDYLTTQVKTGKMTIANMKYNPTTKTLEYHV